MPMAFLRRMKLIAYIATVIGPVVGLLYESTDLTVVSCLVFFLGGALFASANVRQGSFLGRAALRLQQPGKTPDTP